MQKPYHAAITRAALAGKLPPAPLDAVVAANLGQDSLLNLLRSEFHFDANAFDAAFEYVRSQEEDVLAGLASGSPQKAWRAFGRLSHALQDFYAHTNYVAIWREMNPDVGPDVEVDPLVPEIIDSPRLVAARVYYPLEALTIFPALVPFLQRRLPADSHANMNLDSPERGPLFPLAVSAARGRTRLAFEEIARRAAERGLDLSK